MKRIRVVLGDLQALNLEGMNALLKGINTLSVVATADSPKKLVEAVKAKSPDVIVADSQMLRNAAGRSINGSSKVIQIADSDTQIAPTPATKGVVRRTETSRELKEAIRRVAKGQTYALPEPTMTGKKLSRREQEIAQLVAQGMSNRAIADQLDLSEQSVKNLVSRILRKTGLNNRVQLALSMQ